MQSRSRTITFLHQRSFTYKQTPPPLSFHLHTSRHPHLSPFIYIQADTPTSLLSFTYKQTPPPLSFHLHTSRHPHLSPFIYIQADTPTSLLSFTYKQTPPPLSFHLHTSRHPHLSPFIYIQADTPTSLLSGRFLVAVKPGRTSKSLYKSSLVRHRAIEPGFGEYHEKSVSVFVKNVTLPRRSSILRPFKDRTFAKSWMVEGAYISFFLVSVAHHPPSSFTLPSGVVLRQFGKKVNAIEKMLILVCTGVQDQ